ncbi:MAG: hypothetical protein HFG96_01225 [Lachnospiraceae bacterium]|nr:hypothetical protein [Lachnospiraceae bacterium]
MKAFINSIKKIKERPRLQFLWSVCGFYVLMMTLYLYFMLANLSSAPKFVYAQF